MLIDVISPLTRGANRFAANSYIGRKLLRTTRVDDDLETVTDIDARHEVPGESVGLAAGDVAAIWRSIEDMYCTGYYPAIMCCLRRRGKIVLNRAIGWAAGFGEAGGPGTPRRATIDTPACIYSASKAITAMLVHRLADHGAINLLDPVAHYVPEFGRRGKDRLSILQILSHRGGVPGIKTNLPMDVLLDHETLFRLICDAEPIDEHGRTQAYHAITGGTVLQAVVERVTGEPIQTYWNTHFKSPMGFRHFDYGATGAGYDAMARDQFSGAPVPRMFRDYFKQYLGLDVEVDRDFINSPVFFREPVPAGNMVATAEEASRFFQMLLDNGRYRGRSIVSALAVQRATREIAPHQFDNVLKVPLRYSAGMMLGGDPVGLFGWKTPNAFGHLGMINIFVWADPDRDLAGALLTTGKPLLAHNLPYVANTLRTITRRVPRDGQRGAAARHA